MFAEELNLAQCCMFVCATCVGRAVNTHSCAVVVFVDVSALMLPSAKQAPVVICAIPPLAIIHTYFIQYYKNSMILSYRTSPPLITAGIVM